ncbi:MAG: molybdenum cofactor guanylyltransferase MobA [Parvularculaceae bacterium]
MGGADKGAVLFRGSRLIDHVFERLGRQCDRIIISGPCDYGLGAPFIEDLRGRLAKEDPASEYIGGPARGVASVARQLASDSCDADGFVTAPVDGPFLPPDLAARLTGETSAISADDDGPHPTFAYWRINAVNEAIEKIRKQRSLSLRRLAEMVGARMVAWPGDEYFANINSPADLARHGRNHPPQTQ